MALASKKNLAMTILVLAFLCMAFVSSLALNPTCIGPCASIKKGCQKICQNRGFVTGACMPPPSSMCCCHDQPINF
ncbi:unnamed protein product [Lactuca virosa]|uniref:Uncharacterized protein n=1 Tax=Lactuca virosa TaxID=75947 RepID=A0AAU9PEH3_9ASTR|nr:unnamed protein product [Lactuca virosa]